MKKWYKKHTIAIALWCMPPIVILLSVGIVTAYKPILALALIPLILGVTAYVIAGTKQ